MGSSISEYPNLFQWGILVPAQRSRSLYDLCFHKQAGTQGNVLTCITIADAMVNDRVDGFKSLFIAEMVEH